VSNRHISFWHTQASIVDSVSCPDPYTAVFHLSAPFQGFVWNLVNVEPSTGRVMSKAAWEKLGRDGYEKTPVGTGPYMLQSLVPNQDVILIRNPDYWGPRPAVDEIDFKAIADAQTAALGVKTGSADIAQVDPVTAARYEHTPGVRLLARQGLRTGWLEINTTLKPFDNVRVRQAMRYAIDYPGLVSAMLRGFGVAGYAGMMMPGMTRFDAAVNPQNTYDQAKARELLKASGVSLPINGFFTTYNDTLDVDAAQFIAANLAQVGINLEARPLERGTLVQERIKPTTPASVIGTALSPDPDFLFSLTFISKENPRPASTSPGTAASTASMTNSTSRRARPRATRCCGRFSGGSWPTSRRSNTTS
jgi:peptide/nickel transport system substrate-binding protein